MRSFVGIIALALVTTAVPLLGGAGPASDAAVAGGTAADTPFLTGAPVQPAMDPVPSVDRYMFAPAGTERSMVFDYGPVVVPPGSNINRVLVDLPPYDGFLTSYAPGMRDTVSGDTHPEGLHLHHAHWLHLAQDGEEDYRSDLPGLTWVYGTGGETTKADIDERSEVDPDGPRYGLFLRGAEPMTLVFMVHNQLKESVVVYIQVEVDFVYGTADSILAAHDCGGPEPSLLPAQPVPGTTGCAAGEEFHGLLGRLWGNTFDVPREPLGEDRYIYPPDEPRGRFFEAPWDGIIVGTAGHMHENGRQIAIANLGPEGSGCEEDLDGDGYPGITLLHSKKVDREPAAWPHSHDFQMTTTKTHFRSPVFAGDRIAQFADYANKQYATYGAMSYVGMYVDPHADPHEAAMAQRAAAREAGSEAGSPGPERLHGEDVGCLDRAPYLLEGGEGEPSEGVLSQEWGHGHGHLCGEAFGHACDTPEEPRGDGVQVGEVRIQDFVFQPGDRSLDGAEGAPVKVPKGQSLRFVNLDTSLLVRHAVTTCAWPCNGEAASNYPQADGRAASPNLGNMDALDGGVTGPEASPSWETPTDLESGWYSYYCRMHPWMRGAFVVLEDDGELPPAPTPEAMDDEPVETAANPGEGDASTPAPALPLLLGAIAGLAVALRRRR